MSRLFSVVEAARQLEIDPSTLWRWTDLGLISPTSRTLGGPRRRGRLLFTEERINEIREQMQTQQMKRSGTP